MASPLRSFLNSRPISSLSRVCQLHSSVSSGLSSRQSHSASRVAPFAFAFDIDGVLCRSNGALPGAAEALKLLRAHHIPFILLTNGGGKTEKARTTQLSKILDVTIPVASFVQSHTPFTAFSHLRDATILVLGGPHDGHSCRLIAQEYGLGREAVTPLDLYAAYPDIWPFGPDLVTKDKQHIHSLPRPLAPPFAKSEDLDHKKYLKIDAAFVFNDPRAWALDSSILLDTLLSNQGFIGTVSTKNGEETLPNRGYLQDGQPRVYFSNPDVLWAAEWPHPRLGQGAFRAAFEGVWHVATGGTSLESQAEQWGKPYGPTYRFAEERLTAMAGTKSLRTVYMVGDNPESDIRGANSFESAHGTSWRSILVRSGVYTAGKPAYEPKMTVNGVLDAVHAAFKEQGLEPKLPSES